MTTCSDTYQIREFVIYFIDLITVDVQIFNLKSLFELIGKVSQ